MNIMNKQEKLKASLGKNLPAKPIDQEVIDLLGSIRVWMRKIWDPSECGAKRLVLYAIQQKPSSIYEYKQEIH